MSRLLAVIIIMKIKINKRWFIITIILTWIIATGCEKKDAMTMHNPKKHCINGATYYVGTTKLAVALDRKGNVILCDS